MNANTLELPIGNGLRLRITRNPESNGVVAQMIKGRWPNCTQLAFLVAHANELDQVRIRVNYAGQDTLWIGSACVDVNALAAKRIGAWLAGHGIGAGAAAAATTERDALDRLDLNTNTPWPAAPGGTA